MRISIFKLWKIFLLLTTNKSLSTSLDLKLFWLQITVWIINIQFGPPLVPKGTYVMNGFFSRCRGKRLHLNSSWLCSFFKCLQMGKWSSIYYFFRRTLKWSILEYTRYTSILGMVGVFANFFIMPFLSNTLKLRDTTILLVCMNVSKYCYYNCILKVS